MEQLIRVGNSIFSRENATSNEHQLALSQARTQGVRAHCLCSKEGVEMYIGHRSGTFYIAKMPGTGCGHQATCPSFDMDSDLSGQAMDGDRIALSANFPLTRRGLPNSISLADDLLLDATFPPRKHALALAKKISLQELLRLLWSQAELNRWVPRMEGKRNWGLIRHLLTREASSISLSGVPLESRLFIPEIFRSEEQEQHRERNVGALEELLPLPENHSQRRQFAIVIGIAKTYRPSKFGCKVQLKHLPETTFFLDSRLARSVTEKHTFELLAIGREYYDHVLTAMVVERTENGHYAAVDMALIRTTKEWIPVETAFDLELVQYLVGYSRSFVRVADKSPVSAPPPVVYLVDTGPTPTPLYIDSDPDHGKAIPNKWHWRPALGHVSSTSLPKIA